jgi:uncharacterized protein YceH (UPF0502 family)
MRLSRPHILANFKNRPPGDVNLSGKAMAVFRVLLTSGAVVERELIGRSSQFCHRDEKTAIHIELPERKFIE